MKNLNLFILIMALILISLGAGGCAPGLGSSSIPDNSTGSNPNNNSSGIDGFYPLPSPIRAFSDFQAELNGTSLYWYGAMLLEDGTVAMKSPYINQYYYPVEYSDIQAIPTVNNHSTIQFGATNYNICALNRNSDVICWGENEHGQVGNGSFESTFIKNLTLGNDSLYYTDAAQLYDHNLTFKNVKEITNFSITGGYSNETMCVIDNLSDLYCWGRAPFNGSFGDNRSSNTPIKLASEVASLQISDHKLEFYLSDNGSVIRLEDGIVMGSEIDTFPGCISFQNRELRCPRSGYSDSNIISVTDDRDLLSTYTNYYINSSNELIEVSHGDGQPSVVKKIGTGYRQVVQIGPRSTHCGLKLTGEVFCWGQNGSLGNIFGSGNETLSSSSEPVEVGGITNGKLLMELSFDSWTDMCVLTNEGKIHCWGDSFNGIKTTSL